MLLLQQPQVFQLTLDVSDSQPPQLAQLQEQPAFHNQLVDHTQSNLDASKELTEFASGPQQQPLQQPLHQLQHLVSAD